MSNRAERRRRAKLEKRQRQRRVSRPAGTNPDLKKAIVETARAIFKDKSPLMAASAGTCVYQAAALVAAGQIHGVTIIPQGGSAFWRRINIEEDDGTEDSHWGFQYDPSTLKSGVSHGLPLEVHVWCAIPETGEIIDTSAGDFPRTARELGGISWPGRVPPDYLWCRADSPPQDAAYQPIEDATIRATQAVVEIWTAWQKGLQYVPPGWEANQEKST